MRIIFPKWEKSVCLSLFNRVALKRRRDKLSPIIHLGKTRKGKALLKVETLPHYKAGICFNLS
jgi:hypothetical protein